MRIAIGRIGVALPFLEIGKAVAIGILLENVCIGDRQSKLLEPFVRHRGMHFSRL